LVPEGRVSHLKEKLATVKAQMRKLGNIEKHPQGPRLADLVNRP